MNKLKKANEYIKEHQVSKQELPVFHVAPPIGWMNDPNGFSAYHDQIHLFYQHHPYSEVWGPMHWGHCVSSDFVKWDIREDALAPEEYYDAGGCFSGSGMETEDGHLLVYTGVMEETVNGKTEVFQNQCIAYGDGITYKKYEANPVVKGDMLPENFSREHFRDPKIWEEADGYYMLVGNKTEENVPQVVLFRSNDLKEWHYVSVLASDVDGRFGAMWECPDFFSVDGQHILLVSPQDMEADREFHNGNNAVCFVGEYRQDEHKFQYHNAYSLDYGLDFYAPQTMLAPDGRRIMIAWMQSWDSNIRPADQKWACMMTLPRELRFEDGRLLQRPVREIEKYYTKPVRYENQEIAGECVLQGIKGRVLDLSVDILSDDFREFGICFACDDRYSTSLTYDKEKNRLKFDRTYSGMVRDTISFRRVHIKNPKGVLKLRLILDKYSVEAFVNDGEQVLSATFYTPMSADEVRFFCDKSVLTTIQNYTISVE